MSVEADGANLRLSIADDGVGGADPHKGSGLIGLIDRVEALGGQLRISSLVGSGTSLLAMIPCRRILTAIRRGRGRFRLAGPH